MTAVERVPLVESGCRLRLVMFDLDGTIIDTMEVYAGLASQIISNMVEGLNKDRVREVYLATAGRSFRDQLQAIGVPGEMIEEIAARFEESKIESLRDVRPAGRVVERIKLLKRSGLRIALSTNNECRVIEGLDWARELFDYILCHDPDRGIGKGKPHLEMLLEAGFRRCEIVFVGDSDYDLEVYRPLGVKTLRTRGLWRADDNTVEKILELANRGEGTL